MTNPSKQRRLSDIDAQIRDRATYLKQQEHIVDEAIATFNVRLQEFHRELEIANDRKMALLRDIQRLEDDKALLEAQVAILENTYKERVEAYRTHLLELQQ